jgi:hypothetical protein
LQEVLKKRKTQMPKQRGYFIEYQSTFTGEHCVAIITGTETACRNTKTGDMAQMWFLERDLHPMDSIALGKDASVCGDCKLRRNFGSGECYATKGRGAQAMGKIWKAHQKGKYERFNLDSTSHLRTLRAKPIRLGAYGDPASMPIWYWDTWFKLVKPNHWTGYTHQWRDFPELRYWFMASVDSGDEFRAAHKLGFRTFRILHKQKGEITDHLFEKLCPASKEAKHKTTCARCGQWSWEKRQKT